MNNWYEELSLAIGKLKEDQHEEMANFSEQYNLLKEKYTELKNKEKDLKTRITLQNKLMELDDAYIAFMNRQIGKHRKHRFT